MNCWAIVGRPYGTKRRCELCGTTRAGGGVTLPSAAPQSGGRLASGPHALHLWQGKSHMFLARHVSTCALKPPPQYAHTRLDQGSGALAPAVSTTVSAPENQLRSMSPGPSISRAATPVPRPIRPAADCSSCFGCRRPRPCRPLASIAGRPPAGFAWHNRYCPRGPTIAGNRR